MIIKTSVSLDDKKRQPSFYRPSKAVREITQKVLSDFTVANAAKEKSYREFNNMTVLQRQSVDQMRFNGYQFTSTEPDEEWKSNAVRPISRNRVISIAAHLTGNTIYPSVFAQNDKDEEDQTSAIVMRDLMEWAGDNSNGGTGYEKTFLYAVIAALVNPAVIIHTEFAEVYRTVKEMQDDGSYTKKQILDEIFSGFQDSITPIDEFWHPDFYENDIQRQPFLIRRRALMYDVAEGKYGTHKNWKYIKKGLQIMYVEDTGQFYEQYDDSLREHLVEEIIYWNRSKDLMLTFVNGVIMCDPEQPNPREDKKYPFIKTGYEPIDEGKFFYYKSCIHKMGPDEEIVQTLYRMVIDGTYLQLMPPMALFGDEEVTSSIMTPGSVTNLGSESKMQNLRQGTNLDAGMKMLEKVESSMNESSVDPQQSGVQGGGNKTAFEVGRLEENAKVLLGLFGRMIGFLVKDWGELRVPDILQYMTLGDVLETGSQSSAMKFKTFLIPNKTINGQKKTRKIRFKAGLPDSDTMTQAEKEDKEFQLLEEAGNDTELVDANPELFRRRKFLLRVSPEAVSPASDNLKRALNLEEYDRAQANPLADQEAIFRDLLLGSYDQTKTEPDKYIKRQSQDLAGLISPQQPLDAKQASGNSAVAQLTNQRAQQATASVLKGGQNI